MSRSGLSRIRRVWVLLILVLAIAGCHGVTVQIPQHDCPDNMSAKLSRSHNQHPKKIRWHNTASVSKTLTFTAGSPFPGVTTITVGPGQKTQWYELPSTGDNRKFPYHISPPADSCPPDDPDADVGP